MSIYSVIPRELYVVVKEYMSRKEFAKISEGIEYNKKVYKEIIFTPSKRMVEEFRGCLYIDENNDTVTDKSIQIQLSKLTYYLNVFCNEKSKLYIKKALENDDDIKNQKNDFYEINKALEALNSEGLKGIEKVEDIMEKILELRIRSNDRIKELLLKVDEYKKDNDIYSESILYELCPIYREILMINFKKVKLIESGKKYYDSIKISCKKRKKWFDIFTGKSKNIPFMKLSNIIGGYEKILSTYAPILSMHENQYEKFLIKREKDNIDAKMKLIRIK
ncbi:hypothetical protein OW763_04190 [Clostridium aestuarii]|uniref:Uncharacterized protein n=1 Tax=Clostridium aestuarii TaxID=338193 RepID=A0ABT4CX29_9CLOT|nr:hypothetical protein [Clostridium aestuarii]MCY6483551.1 hypothetical protein [Clostridium aestuarii]